MSESKIEILDGLILYKQQKSKYWWCKLNLKNGTKPVRFSTKKVDKDEAKADALIWYEDAKKKGYPSPTIFGHKKMLDQAILRAISENNKKITKTKRNMEVMLWDMFNKLKNIRAANINVDMIESDILSKNSNTRRTMRKACWKMILEASVDLKIYENGNVPRIPKIAKEEEEKSKVSDSDLILMISRMQSFIDNATNEKSRRNREILKDYLKFILTTGSRPGEEVLELKFSDINDSYVKITAGKIHSKSNDSYREVFLNNRTLMLLKRRAKLLNIKWHKKHRSDKYVFQRDDNKVPHLDAIFPQFLKFCNIEKGKYRAYSLRKNYITNQLKKGAPVTTVAKQCGTSIEMINKYYNKSNIRDLSHQLK